MRIKTKRQTDLGTTLDYRCILKISEQLRDLLECNNRLRLWVISLYKIRIFDEV